MNLESALPIIAYPDSRLRKTSIPVTAFDATLTETIAALRATLRKMSGIGLSAPQVGLLRRIVLVDDLNNDEPPAVFINPTILAQTSPGLVEESCLSLPGIVGNVIRATRVTVEAFDEQGQPFCRDLENMEAVCLQHEIDHLDGKLFIDRLSALRRLQLWLTGVTRHSVDPSHPAPI